MRVDIPKDNPNMTCQAVPLQSQSMVSNHPDHDPPSRPDATPVLSHRPPPPTSTSGPLDRTSNAERGYDDDTAMNGIRLICSKVRDRSLTYTVESHTGHWGHWSLPQYCPSGVLTSVQLHVEAHQGQR
ncbi:unnamed protein product [Pleuronectes platessa]|uniref:Uncharacterized protein n=1 Tax=Pleuronectes platessa TaxID=8262 RepID=A0A9N7UYS8_PLEPL|nr:unnamed protein product [Pleuronectes platessa]